MKPHLALQHSAEICAYVRFEIDSELHTVSHKAFLCQLHVVTRVVALLESHNYHVMPACHIFTVLWVYFSFPGSKEEWCKGKFMYSSHFIAETESNSLLKPVRKSVINSFLTSCVKLCMPLENTELPLSKAWEYQLATKIYSPSGKVHTTMFCGRSLNRPGQILSQWNTYCIKRSIEFFNAKFRLALRISSKVIQTYGILVTGGNGVVDIICTPHRTSFNCVNVVSWKCKVIINFVQAIFDLWFSLRETAMCKMNRSCRFKYAGCIFWLPHQ